ncbi:hypothetical protein [Singulisphaera sp. PoT]|uniref:hypothetical protein n=1 Tax=Singulisphaera sp. PoT TaxID=3411797 RepID=UPI003BF48C0B
MSPTPSGYGPGGDDTFGGVDPGNVPLPGQPATGYQPAEHGELGGIDPGNVENPQATSGRDWLILEDIARRLDQTGEFSGVHLTGPPEAKGSSSGEAKSAYLELDSWEEVDESDDEYDVQNTVRARFRLTLAARENDAETRDRELDRLLGVAKNAINGRPLLDRFVILDWSKLLSGKWEPATPPERRMAVIGQFAYFVDGDDKHSEEE